MAVVIVGGTEHDHITETSRDTIYIKWETNWAILNWARWCLDIDNIYLNQNMSAVFKISRKNWTLRFSENWNILTIFQTNFTEFGSFVFAAKANWMT